MERENGFIHSKPVPPFFKICAKILKKFCEGKGSIKSLIYSERRVSTQKCQAIVTETCRKKSTIEALIKQTKLFEKEPRFDPWLAQILIYELLWVAKKLTADCKPIQTILKYEQELNDALGNVDVKEDLIQIKVKKPRYVRVNTLLTTTQEVIDNFRDEGWVLVPFLDKNDYQGYLTKIAELGEYEFMIDIHIPELLVFASGTTFYNHVAYKKKLIILHDKASCLAVHLLKPTPESTVIDMCAAPGMKTTHLSALMENKGQIYAVEKDSRRFKILEEIVTSHGATNVKCMENDVLQVDESTFGNVDYILVDPSCSGSGMTERLEFAEKPSGLDLQRLTKLAGFQIKILRRALIKFKTAKRVVYSTCSLHPEENEDVVRQVLETCYTFKLVNAKELLGGAWNQTGSDQFGELGKMCIYAVPEKDLTNGFFVAVFERIHNMKDNQFINSDLVMARRMVDSVDKAPGPFLDKIELAKMKREKRLRKKELRLKELEAKGKIMEVEEIGDVEMENSVQEEIGFKNNDKRMKIKDDEEINIESNDDESKKKKRKNKETEQETICSLEEIGDSTESIEIVHRKKHKKDKKHKTIEDETENNLENIEEAEKKKHKNKKHQETDETIKKENEHKSEASEISVVDEKVEKKKKNKKNKRDLPESDSLKELEHNNSSEIINKKKKTNENETADSDNIIEQNTSEIKTEKHKKKKKKKHEDETDEIAESDNIIDEKSASKKRKTKDLENESTFETEIEIKILFKKKIHKKSKAEISS